MKKDKIYKIIIGILTTVLIFLTLSLSNNFVKIKTVDKAISLDLLIPKFVKSLNKGTLDTIGINQSDALSNNLSHYNINIVPNKTDDHYIILHNVNRNNDKEYLTIFERKLFTYKQLGKPLEFNNVVDVFVLPVNTKEKYILFSRDLVGFKTSPLDLKSYLYAYVYNDKKNNFEQALEILENAEEYVIQKGSPLSNYKKYRTKSDIMLINEDYPIMKVLTHYYEAISKDFDTNLSGTPAYSLDFNIVKTNSTFDKYFYDTEFYHFLLGYMTLDQNNEKVGIIKKNIKQINDNYKDTYTIIRKNGETFEIFDDYTIQKINE